MTMHIATNNSPMTHETFARRKSSQRAKTFDDCICSHYSQPSNSHRPPISAQITLLWHFGYELVSLEVKGSNWLLFQVHRYIDPFASKLTNWLLNTD